MRFVGVASQSARQTVESLPAPSLLRWQKVDSGGVVTWSYNDSGNPTLFTGEQLTAVVREALATWAGVARITFFEVTGTSDIEFLWDQNGDGAGGTLAYVFQPNMGIDMAACGVCGDINTDTAESWSIDDLFNVILHEAGHSLGLGHVADYTPPTTDAVHNVMNPFYSMGSPRFSLSVADINEVQLRYPR